MTLEFDGTSAGTGELVEMLAHGPLLKRINALAEGIENLQDVLLQDLDENELRASVRTRTCELETHLNALKLLAGIPVSGPPRKLLNISDVDMWTSLVKSLTAPTPFQREDAAGALSEFAKDEANIIAISAAGAIDPLVDLLRDESQKVRAEAAGALKHLARTSDNKVVIVSAGGIEPLIDLLGTDRTTSLNAAGALKNLATDDIRNAVAIGKAGATEPLVDLLQHDCFKVREEAVGALMSLAVYHGNLQPILDAGAVQHLVKLLDRSAASKTKGEGAASALQQLTAAGDNAQAAIVKAGAIQPLVKLLRDGCQQSRREALLALRSIVAGSEEYRRAVLAAGATAPSVDVLRCSGRKDEEVLEAMLYIFGIQTAP